MTPHHHRTTTAVRLSTIGGVVASIFNLGLLLAAALRFAR